MKTERVFQHKRNPIQILWQKAWDRVYSELEELEVHVFSDSVCVLVKEEWLVHLQIFTKKWTDHLEYFYSAAPGRVGQRTGSPASGT